MNSRVRLFAALLVGPAIGCTAEAADGGVDSATSGGSTGVSCAAGECTSGASTGSQPPATGSTSARPSETSSGAETSNGDTTGCPDDEEACTACREGFVEVDGACVPCATDPIPADALFVAVGGNDGGTGTEKDPFATLQHAANTVAPGQTVVVEDGIYTSSEETMVLLSASGTEGAPIVFRARHRGAAVLHGDDNSVLYVFRLVDGVHDVVFEGFEIREARHAALWAANIEGVERITFRYNDVHDIGRHAATTASALAVGVTTTELSQGFLVQGNRFARIGRRDFNDDDSVYDHPVYLEGDGHRVVNNVFEDHKGGWCVQTTNETSNMLIANNTFDCFNPDLDGAIMIWNNGPGNVIANNVFLGARTSALGCWQHTSAEVTLVNNAYVGGQWLDSNDQCAGPYAMTGGVLNAAVSFDDGGYIPAERTVLVDGADPAFAPEFDHRHAPRDAAPDIGAFERGTSACR